MSVTNESDRGHCLVVGAGGNIGSHLVPHLARSAAVRALTLVDRDTYEPGNLAGQNVAPADVGRPKAEVQAEGARRLAPSLEVRAIHADLDALPLGAFEADLILACLDNRLARQTVNEAATRLGVPWIDAGVLQDGLLARIDVYPSDGRAACLECGWEPSDYATLEQRYACSSGDPLPPATGAWSCLGSLAASLQAIEARKLLRERDPWDAAFQVVYEGEHHRHLRTALPANPRCRFGSHAPWPILRAEGPETMSVHRLVEAAHATDPASVFLGVAGRCFAPHTSCARCASVDGRPRLLGRQGAVGGSCARCGAGLETDAPALPERMSARCLLTASPEASLAELGFEPGMVVTLTDDRSGPTHVQLGPWQPVPRRTP